MTAKDTKPVKLDWAKGPCEGVDRIPALNGLTAEEVTARLGPSGTQQSFLMGERQDEFHIVLQNTYPLSKPANHKVAIREWTWTQGSCRLTVWFHKVKDVWKSFENSRYSSKAEF